MNCCSINITPFALQSSTTITYSGVKPTVSVAYLQTDGSFITIGVFTNIILTGTSLTIDHGGPASGYIKLVQ